MNVKRLAVLAACVLGVGVATGTGAAAGPGTAWQDIWAKIKPLLSDPGTINDAQNPVDWTKLKGVPAGIADGLDNGVDRAGFGLEKNLFPALEFAVDTTKIQRRVTGECPVGQTVQSIRANGSVACAAGAPVVYYGLDWGDGEPVYHNYTTVGGELSIPAGSWSLAAMLDLSGHRVLCKLEARANGTVRVLDNQRDLGDTPHTTTLMGVYSSATPWRAAVACKKMVPTNGALWYQIKIAVTQVGELHHVRLGF